MMHVCDLNFYDLKGFLKQAQDGNHIILDKKTENCTLTEKGRVFCRTSKLQNKLLTSYSEKDPYNDTGRRKEIEVAASSLLSIKAHISDLTKTYEEITNVNLYRNKYSIIEKIIDEAAEGISKVEVRKKCDLNSTQFHDYLPKLEKIDMLEFDYSVYRAKTKGQLFSGTHKIYLEFLKIWKNQDPLINPKLLAQIEAALSPMLSVRVSPAIITDIFEEPYIAIQK
jgi:hypothetical protein